MGSIKPHDTEVISILDSFTKLASQCNVVDMIYLDNNKTCDKTVCYLCGQSEYGLNRTIKLNNKVIFFTRY